MKTAAALVMLAPLLCVLAGGCAASEKPFYRDDQVVAEPLLIGSWFNEADPKGAAYSVRAAGRRGHYVGTGANPDGSNQDVNLEMALFRLGDHYFVDATPAGDPRPEHRLALVGFSGQKIVVVALDRHPLEELLIGGGGGVPKSRPPGGKSEELLLTDTTEAIQGFLSRNLDALLSPTQGHDEFAVFRTSGRGLPLDEGPTMAGREQRTLLYWWLVGQALREPLPGPASRRDIKDLTGRFVEFVSGLSVLGVDPAAVKAGQELVAFFKAVTDSLNEDGGPRSETIAAFHRAGRGDVLGAVADDLNSRHLLGNNAKKMRDGLSAAAGALNGRYRVRFGQLPF